MFEDAEVFRLDEESATGKAGDLTPPLADRVARSERNEALEVVIELKGSPMPASGSRQERISAAKSNFESDLAQVTAVITAAGGEVLDAAWLNRTLRGSVPAGALSRVAADDRVATIDLPRSLEPDARPMNSRTPGAQPTKKNPAP